MYLPYKSVQYISRKALQHLYLSTFDFVCDRLCVHQTFVVTPCGLSG